MDLRKISAWVAIVAVPTMIAGIYGMNFDNMPDCAGSTGTHAPRVIAAVMLSLYIGFKRNRWL